MKKMAAQVYFFCFLMFFSVWRAIWCLKIGTFVLIKVLLKKKISTLVQRHRAPNRALNISLAFFSNSNAENHVGDVSVRVGER